MSLRDSKRTGLSISEIARTMDLDRKTVRKWLNTTTDVEPRYKRQAGPSKLEPYHEYIMARMGEGVLNATVLLGEIRGQGYSGQYTILKDYIRPFRQQAKVIASRRFETRPGEQGQMDFGHFGSMVMEDGTRKNLYAFVFVLGYSRAIYVEFVTDQTVATVLRCHRNAFAALGGAQQKILYDNFKAAVVGRDDQGQPIWHPELEGFLKTVGSRPTACAPRKPQCKGKVESGVKYVRRNFWPGRHYTHLEDLNHQAQAWAANVANVRLHGTTYERPVDRLEREHGLLLATAKLRDYQLSLKTERTVTTDAFVHYQTCRYSVPWKYAGEVLQLEQTESGDLLMLYKGLEIARHRVVTARHRNVILPAHHQGIPSQPAQTAKEDPCQHQLATPDVQERSLTVYEEVAS